jgi:hypothetical protein
VREERDEKSDGVKVYDAAERTLESELRRV